MTSGSVRLTKLTTDPIIGQLGNCGLTMTFGDRTVSVIVPVFNRPVMVVELVNSILHQTWRPIEIILVDDGSTDDTLEVLKNIPPSEKHCRFVVLTQDNAGPASARNRGLSHARGMFILFVDSDDLLLPNAIETMVVAIETSCRPYCLAEMQNADEAGNPILGDVEGVPRQIPGNYVKSGWMTHGALYRRTAIASSGAFNESLGIGEDTEFQWRMMAINGPAHILSEKLGVRRLHSHGHLSMGQSVEQIAQSKLRTILAFQAWLDSQNCVRNVADQSFCWTLLVCGILLGNSGDWAARDLAFGAFDRIPSKGLSVRAVRAAFRFLPDKPSYRILSLATRPILSGRRWWRNNYRSMLACPGRLRRNRSAE
jgi:glycosyltransferase involved in cell wall biosynthesis